MSGKLVVCFDGTWNKDEAQKYEYKETNVKRIFDSIVETDLQKKKYIQGVGTENWLDKIIGGISGRGLSENIVEGYSWLSQNYNQGDKIYIFGFSRGAYSARSLVGMIRNIGLLYPENLAFCLYRAYEIYQQRDEGPDTEEAIRFRNYYSRDPHETGIHFVGIWDTVGSLGIPGKIDDQILFQFHDTRLSSIVKNAYHAVAIDERRIDFDVTLWNPLSENHSQRMEQRWFAGAHSDVGGGYRERDLADITLKWMQGKARSCGLTLCPDQLVQSVAEKYTMKCHDSCWDCPLWQAIIYLLRGRIIRHIGRTTYGNEKIDQSVSLKCRDKKCRYNPQNPGLRELQAL